MSQENISPASHIIIKGARQHNLKDIDLNLPKNKLIVFTGLSGSGKSSLAFDTIYAEGQRKYVESLSSYARQFLGIMKKPDVDQIEGLSPAISIDQKTTSHNPRSTVGTITEIYDYLRLLFARIGHPHCPDCHIEISPQDQDQITSSILERILDSFSGSKPSRWIIFSPVIQDKKGEFSQLFQNLSKQGFTDVRADGQMISLDGDIVLIKTNRHTIDVVIDRFTITKKDSRSEKYLNNLRSRLSQSIEKALELSDGSVILSQIMDQSLEFPKEPKQFQDFMYNQHLACPNCHRNSSELEPRLFSFNTPYGACPNCDGLGTLLKINPDKIIAPEITLSEGAIIPLASALSSDSWYSRKINSILDYHHIDRQTEFQNIPDEVKHILLYGSKQYYQVSGSNRQGRTASFSFQPEGIIHELERRYQETQSEYIRHEIGKFMIKTTCSECDGARLKPSALAVTVTGDNINQVVENPISQSLEWTDHLLQIISDESDSTLSQSEKAIAAGICREIRNRLDFLSSVGLSYLTLHREAATLAGGEAQRIRLASQIGTGLTGVLYVLDEPTIGLHPRDNDRLIQTLIKLKSLGNTVVVVEHDEKVISSADHVVDFGPLAGDHGGDIVFQGNVDKLKNSSQSLTGKYMSGKKSIDSSQLKELSSQLQLHLIPKQSKPVKGNLVLSGASQHNLKNLHVEIPLGKFVVVSGVSGSGKSTLVHETLYPALRSSLGMTTHQLGKYSSLTGTSQVDKVYLIDQSPIGRTPRSNPATYTKMFDHIRQIFAGTKEAKSKGFKPGRFSFNVKGGRCEACQGGGQVKIAMQFLSDIYVTCDVCHGRRYNLETLSVRYKNLNIAQVLDLTIDQALNVFNTSQAITKKLLTLKAVGLGYITLGQAAPTLSGGEAQRVKLAKELSINSSGHTVYLLDEPTTGLHFEDVKNLLVVLKKLVANNNTVIAIEHNMDVIKTADWIIDLGPDGGEAGGQVVAIGNPKDVAANKDSTTGSYLET